MTDTPGLVEVQRQSGVYILAPFDVLETNWPFEPGFVLFCYNTCNYLGVQLHSRSETDVAVGEPLASEGLEPDVWYRMRGPGVTNPNVQAQSDGRMRYPETDRVGVYTLSPEKDETIERAFAVNLADNGESAIAPRDTLEFFDDQTVAVNQSVGRANTLIWPYLALTALLIVCAEWWIYNSRVRF